MCIFTLAVLIYDEDCISDDDLIGSCQADLGTLDSWVPTEVWVQVRNTERENQVREANVALRRAAGASTQPLLEQNLLGRR